MSKKKREISQNKNKGTTQTAGEFIEMNDNLDESIEAPKKDVQKAQSVHGSETGSKSKFHVKIPSAKSSHRAQNAYLGGLLDPENDQKLVQRLNNDI